MSISDVIEGYKKNIHDILDKKFADQSFLLGFNLSVQAKYQSWIIQDFDEYQKNLEQEFTTIDFFESIWVNIHYPIIKFFQHQHVIVLEQHNKDLKSCQKEGRPGEFKVKPVEIRKINDAFVKFVLDIYLFYSKLLKYFVTRFKNPYLPDKFIQHFKFALEEDAIECHDLESQGNILHLVHRCCVCLGDMFRHQAFIETNYVIPCSSNKEFFRFKSLTDKKNLLPCYAKSMQYYELCIMILPVLSEPYNHTGVIYNCVDDKFTAIYWFLRSQFTRLQGNQLGFNNLTAILKKHWFTTALVDIVQSSAERRFSPANKMNVYLICLIGYIYCPERYKNGPNIVKKISFSKIETDLFKSVNTHFNEMVLLQHLVVLFSFIRLSQNEEQKEKLVRFAFRYVEKILVSLKTNEALVLLRFILNILFENPDWLQVFSSRRNCVVYMSSVLNNYLSSRYPDTGTRPTRLFYFSDDVHFRDWELMGSQYKDFNDDELFEAGNINLLVGDYSMFIAEGSPSLLANGENVEEYTKSKRIQAIVILGLKILRNAREFELVQDPESKKVIMRKKVTRVKEEKEKEKEKDNGLKSKKKESISRPSMEPVSRATQSPQPGRITVPTSLQDIESLISQQAKELTLDMDQNYENMVGALVDDDEPMRSSPMRLTTPIRSSPIPNQNIWQQDQQKPAHKPDFLNQHKTMSSPRPTSQSRDYYSSYSQYS